MKKSIVLFTFLAFVSYAYAQASVLGKWKTIDDQTGKAKSIVQVYEKEGKIYAKILELLDESKKGMLCTQCKGQNKNKPIEGMVIIDGLSKDGNEWNGGKILDPSSGKEYKCYIQMEGNKLKVRGFVGFSLIGRTQYWHRVK